MKGRFELGVEAMSAVRSVAEERMSQETAETLLKEDQEDCAFHHPLVGEAIGVARAIALEQAVGAHLAQVVAELVQPMAGRSEKRMCPIRVIHES